MPSPRRVIRPPSAFRILILTVVALSLPAVAQPGVAWAQSAPPTAFDNRYTIYEDSGPNSFAVLRNDTDPDGGVMQVVAVTDPAHGTAQISDVGTRVTYAPDANYCNRAGTDPMDTFGYTLNGGSTATVSVAVRCVADPPTAVDDAYTITQGTGSKLFPVARNDIDSDGGAITVIATTPSANADVTIIDRKVGYDPDPAYCTASSAPADTFTYTLNGGDVGTVSVRVRCANLGPRLGATDLQYRGAFLLPAPVDDVRTFAYGGTALASDSAHDSLFLVGHDWYQHTAEVTTPEPAIAAGPGGLRRAGFRQGLADATDGKLDDTGGAGNKVGGQLVYGNRLYGSAYIYYDAAGEQVRSHWSRPSTSLSTGTAAGLFEVGNAGAGFVSGYMAEVPPFWRERLGGPALTGNCCIPIISRTSLGPAASAFDPASMAPGALTSSTELVGYPQSRPTVGDWDDTWSPPRGIFFNGTTSIHGLVFPDDTRSVLFFGTQGMGEFCYGDGTDDRDLHGRPTSDGSTWCYDPDDSSKGTHAYPYVAEVWAYDAAALQAVREGRLAPWQAKPYATWELDLPFGPGKIGGAAYDRARGLIYVSQQFGNGDQPVIHVFAVA